MMRFISRELTIDEKSYFINFHFGHQRPDVRAALGALPALHMYPHTTMPHAKYHDELFLITGYLFAKNYLYLLLL